MRQKFEGLQDTIDRDRLQTDDPLTQFVPWDPVLSENQSVGLGPQRIDDAQQHRGNGNELPRRKQRGIELVA